MKSIALISLISTLGIITCYILRYVIVKPYFWTSLDLPEMFVMGLPLTACFIALIVIQIFIQFWAVVYRLVKLLIEKSMPWQVSVIMVIFVCNIALAINYKYGWIDVVFPGDWFYFT